MEQNTTATVKQTPKALYTVRVNDRRPFDYDSGRRLACPSNALVQCECCGKRCAVTHVMNNGVEVGRECATLLERPDIWAICGLGARQIENLTVAITAGK
jgi:hypothetical protein